MPTYEYECLDCKRRFEIFQKISEEKKEICPYCGGRVRRLISAGIGLIFKGSGFYITDYKRKEPSQAKEKEEKKDNKKDNK